MMILATGATGNVGAPLLQQLTDQRIPVRGVTRNPRRLTESFPAAEAVEADVSRPETLAPAFEGVRSLFLLFPADGDLPGILRLAGRAGVEHVVHVSSLLAQTHPDTSMGRGALDAEEVVRDSGLDWTILRPWEFASNAAWWAPDIREHGMVRAWQADVGSPVIDPSDIASVAVRALLDEGHRGAIHPLTGPAETTPPERVRAVGDALGRELVFEEMSEQEALRQMKQYMPAELAEEMVGDSGSNGSPGVLPTVENVTGTPARPFARWARDHVHLFR